MNDKKEEVKMTPLLRFLATIAAISLAILLGGGYWMIFSEGGSAFGKIMAASFYTFAWVAFCIIIFVDRNKKSQND